MVMVDICGEYKFTESFVIRKSTHTLTLDCQFSLFNHLLPCKQIVLPFWKVKVHGLEKLQHPHTVVELVILREFYFTFRKMLEGKELVR